MTETNKNVRKAREIVEAARQQPMIAPTKPEKPKTRVVVDGKIHWLLIALMIGYWLAVTLAFLGKIQ